jgi:hypothetical protein
MINGESLPYKVAIVRDSLYFKNGKYKSITIEEALKEISEFEEVSFLYVYHFRAKFKKGLNIIRHRYTISLSSSVVENYSLLYVLTTAGRWANRQIDDFTLTIDMGDFQDLSIGENFFKGMSGWKIVGTGKQVEQKAKVPGTEDDRAEFFIQKGFLEFKKINFKLTGDFRMSAFNYYNQFMGNKSISDDTLFDYKRDPLPFSIENQDQIYKPVDALSKSILRNLPFARRGYVFKKPEVKAYYSSQKWYVPDTSYFPDEKLLTQVEKVWLEKL